MPEYRLFDEQAVSWWKPGDENEGTVRGGSKKRRERSFVVFAQSFSSFLRYRPCALRNISLKGESKLKTGKSGEKDGDRDNERERVEIERCNRTEERERE